MESNAKDAPAEAQPTEAQLQNTALQASIARASEARKRQASAEDVAPQHKTSLLKEAISKTLMAPADAAHLMALKEPAAGSLCSLIERHQQATDSPLLTPPRIVSIAKTLAACLMELHRKDACTDISLGTVDSEGGLNPATYGTQKPPPSFTPSAEVVPESTCFYMSPERLTAAKSGSCEADSWASDVWGMGIVLVQLGSADVAAPYGRGLTLEQLEAKLKREEHLYSVPSMPHLPGFNQLIGVCLKMEPKERISACKAFLALHDIGLHVDDGQDSGKRIVTLQSGKLVDVQKEVAAESSTESREGSIVDLCKGTFSGESQDLVLAGRTCLRNGILELPDSCRIVLKDQGISLVGLSIRSKGAHKHVVDAQGGCQALLVGCTVEGGSESAVGLQDTNSRLTARSCTLSSSGSGLACFDGGVAGLEGCELSSSTTHVLHVSNHNSVAAAERCVLRGCGASNVSVQGGGLLGLTRSDAGACGSGSGLCVGGQGTVAAVAGGSISGCEHSGVVVEAGGSVVCSGARLEGNHVHGLAVSGSNSSVACMGSSISHNIQANVAIKGGATVSLTDGCACDGSREGEGCEVKGEGSKLVFKDGHAENNHWASVYVGAGAAAELEWSRLDGSDKGLWVLSGSSTSAAACSISKSRGPNVKVEEGALVKLCNGCDCSSSSGGSGWEVRSEGTLEATDSTASGNAGHNADVAGGSTLRVARCKLLEGSAWGLKVHGTDSRVEGRECYVSNNKHGNMDAEEGGHVKVDGCDFSSSEGKGWVVRGEGTQVEASTSTVCGCSGNIDIGTGACVKLDRCRVDDSTGVGVRVYGGVLSTSLTASGTSMSHSMFSNLEVGGGAHVTLCEGSEASGSKEGRGWVVRGSGSRLDASGSAAVGNKAANVDVSGGASMGLLRCRIAEGRENGLCVRESGSSMHAAACSVTGNQLSGVVVEEGAVAKMVDGCECCGSVAGSGCVVRGGGSRLEFEGCTATANCGPNLDVVDGGSVSARGSRLDEGQNGVRVSGSSSSGSGETSSSSVHCEECSLSGSLSSNVWVKAGACATISRSSCNASADGNGLRVCGQGSSLSLQSCEAHGNARATLVVDAAATCHVSQSSLCGSKLASGLFVRGGSSVNAESCTISGNLGSNVWVENSSSAVLRSCHCNDSHEGHGLLVTKQGSLEAIRTTATGNFEGNAASEVGSSLKLEGCDLGGQSEVLLSPPSVSPKKKAASPWLKSYPWFPP